MATPPPSPVPVWSCWLLGATALLSVTLMACSQGAEPSPSTSPAASAAELPSESTPEAPAGPTLEVRVTGDAVTPAAQQIDLAVGETLTIEVQADRAGELHVQSDPEQMLEFTSGAKLLRLTLDSPGSVDLEEHETGVLIARLLVR